MLRRRVPGTSKPHEALPIAALIAAVIFAFSSFPALAASSPAPIRLASAAEMADFGANGAVFTRIEQALNLPGGQVYDNVVTEAVGTVPPARNGNTGHIKMFVLLFIFLSSVTLLMWRHSRRDDASPRRIGRRI